ncbi:HipA family kinase [Actinophytocola sp.]|uniref:HipA family kinase n=1 Tax=Actinophytocola sp. TaxID=1872138 RepID=UPI002D4C7897|nr:HipA family kinase [Actinophytocola sp.]HYQ63079.1 HipA family kinase [Actinophytocola sp.]
MDQRSLRTVAATRYVTPFREGGSLPGLVEADDLGMYVLKFRGAGQGLKALTAEIIVGELARRLGFRVPELVLVELHPELSRAEPDEEIQDLLRASAGQNLGVDYLPGSFDFNPRVRDPGRDLAARLLWFDTLVLNVDRSWRNPNMLLWHRQPWLIDHGASLIFHHRWLPGWQPAAAYRYDADDHVMMAANPASLTDADAELRPRVTPAVLDEVLTLVPDDWLDPGFGPPDQVRAAYRAYFTARLADAPSWVAALEETRAARV